MTGPRAGQTYPSLSTGIKEADTGRSAFHVDARRDTKFRTLQELRFEVGLYTVLKGAILGGQQLLSKEQVFALADLPSKETLIAQVVGTIAAPLRGLVTVLSGPQRNFVTVLERIKEQKESAA